MAVANSSTSSKRRITGAIVSYLYMISQICVQLIYVPLLLSGIGQDEYGLYQLIGSVMSYIVSINGVLSAGVGRYYCKYRAEGNERMAENTLAISRRLYWMVSGISFCAVFILIWIVRGAYSASLTPRQLDECAAMLVVLGFNTAVSMNNTINVAVITAEERFVFLKGTQLITLLLQPLVVAALLPIMPNALMVTLVVLAMNILSASIQRLFVQFTLKVKAVFYGWDKSLVRGLIGFSFSILLVVAADQLFWKTGQLVIGYFSGPSLVAVYAVGAQIYFAYMNIGTVVSSVYFPRVSELYHGSHDLRSISYLHARVGRITFVICSSVLGAFFILGSEFISLWAGQEFADSYWVALFVMIGLTVDLVQNLSNTILQVANRYLFRGVALLCFAAISLVVSVALLGEVGIIGVALSTSICMIICNGFVMNIYLWKSVGIDVVLFWKEQAKLVFLFIIYTALFYLLYQFLPSPFSSSWLNIICFGILYVGGLMAIYLQFGLKEEEKRLLKRVTGLSK